MSEELDFATPKPTPPQAGPLQPPNPWFTSQPAELDHGKEFTAHAENYIGQAQQIPTAYPDYSGMQAKETQAKSLKDKFTSFFGHNWSEPY